MQNPFHFPVLLSLAMLSISVPARAATIIAEKVLAPDPSWNVKIMDPRVEWSGDNLMIADLWEDCVMFFSRSEGQWSAQSMTAAHGLYSADLDGDMAAFSYDLSTDPKVAVYRQVEGQWELTWTLRAPLDFSPVSENWFGMFGYSVAVSDTRLVVSCPVFADEDGQFEFDYFASATFIYDISGSNPELIRTISDPASSLDACGDSIAMVFGWDMFGFEYPWHLEIHDDSVYTASCSSHERPKLSDDTCLIGDKLLVRDQNGWLLAHEFYEDGTSFGGLDGSLAAFLVNAGDGHFDAQLFVLNEGDWIDHGLLGKPYARLPSVPSLLIDDGQLCLPVRGDGDVNDPRSAWQAGSVTIYTIDTSAHRRVGFRMQVPAGVGIPGVQVERTRLGHVADGSVLTTRSDGCTDDNGIDDPGDADNPLPFPSADRELDQVFEFDSDGGSIPN